jgi:hypothetical protein
MQCAECGGPLVSLRERTRKFCAVCYLLNRTRADQRSPIGPEDRPGFTRDVRMCGSPDEEER